MNTPPFLLGATLLFWGWQCGLAWLAVLIALALEAPRWIRSRWELTQADLDRIWNLCAVLFFGSATYAFASGDGPGAVGGLLAGDNPGARLAALARSGRSLLQILHWMPVTLLPIALAQAYGTHTRLPWSTFSWWLRRQRNHRSPQAPPESGGLNVSWPYAAAVLVAASAVPQDSNVFFIGATLGLAWALWTIRPRSFPAAGWGAVLVLVIGLAYAGQHGLVQLRVLLQRLDAALVAHLSGARFAPDESRTRLGSVGRLKLSGQIVMRLATTSNAAPPTLLREASFNLFKAPIWGASRKAFNGVPSERDGTTWLLRKEERPARMFTLETFLPGGRGTLPLPLHATRLERLPVALETNRFGTAHASSGPGYVAFGTRYHDEPDPGSAPDPEDLVVPAEEREALTRVAAELDLAGQPPAVASARVTKFFADKFRYSTWLSEDHRARTNRSALAVFLLEQRSGHCEYFASATTLLLRHAGIPTRYAVGYSVQERRGDTYVIRQRHAHAWALAWIDNAWRDVDNTPASWHQADAQHASRWQALGDLWSRIRFAFAQWRWGEARFRQYLVWLLAPLVALLAARLYFKRQWNRARPRTDAANPAGLPPGADSDFYRVEQRLREAGFDRAAGETLSDWLTRIRTSSPLATPELDAALTLHYRLRFDPVGLSPGERDALRDAVRAWIERQPGRPLLSAQPRRH